MEGVVLESNFGEELASGFVVVVVPGIVSVWGRTVAGIEGYKM